ncbi:uncharacterized protein B0H18DRAFT_994159 [Fomitopsis serialis]|uniref:uncharacterized protein n=1 Tax=Fomitopsis serialis TaxID=139415 RepID=UPI0020084E7B|nr:uncharacterized protein B0H18DRAFT_994159 [Neoantrodia serialis]KAH9930282.1 hypothetical protein B0H18DRAFT_994159 [Neoantrodia serialis]
MSFIFGGSFSFARRVTRYSYKNASYCLAPEIVERVLDHLWTEPRALKMCSLTCSGWLPATRLHLFRSVRIRSSYDCLRFTSLIISRTSMPITFLQCVREIILQDLPLRGIDMNSVARGFKKLRNVETLGIAFWPAVDLPASLVDDLLRCFPNVTCLRMEECEIEDPVQFVKLFCGFPKISRIQVGDPKLSHRSEGLHPGFDQASMEPMRAILCPRSLHKQTPLPDLVIERLDLLLSKHALRLAGVLCQPRFILRLRHLRVHWYCDYIDPLLYLLDNVVGNALEKIELSINSAGAGTAQSALARVIRKLDVTNVRSLTIGKTHLDRNIHPDTLTWIPTLIEHVIERSRHRVKLHFNIGYREEFTGTSWKLFPWDSIDKLLGKLPARYARRGMNVRVEVWDPKPEGCWMTENGAHRFCKEVENQLPRSKCVVYDSRVHFSRPYRQASVECSMTVRAR